MNPRIKYSADMYQVNADLFKKALAQAKETDLDERPLESANSFHWVAGHMTNSRFEIAQMLGMEVAFPSSKLLGYGAEPVDPTEYPSMEKVMTAWDDITTKLVARFEELTDEDLAAKPPFEIPGVEKTVGGMLAFLQLHESYHVGQLAYINRLHGGERLVG